MKLWKAVKEFCNDTTCLKCPFYDDEEDNCKIRILRFAPFIWYKDYHPNKRILKDTLQSYGYEAKIKIVKKERRKK